MRSWPVIVATLAGACAPQRPNQPVGAEQFALEPARPAELTGAIESATAQAKRAGDIDGQRVLAGLAVRPPTNASVALAYCIVATDGEMAAAQPIDPNSPCENPNISSDGIRCCGAPTAGLQICGYCDEAAREDPTLAGVARRYERRCKHDNDQREATFQRDAAHAWVTWARARNAGERGAARAALTRARKAMDAAHAVDGVDDTALRREIIEVESALRTP